jgi:hypothetical protein
MRSIVSCLGSIADALDRNSMRSIALKGTFKLHFSVNDLPHTKTLKLTKTLENNKVKSLTNIS